MKIVLGLSLLLNIFLGYRALTSSPVVTQEKVVVRTAKPKVIERKVFVEVPVSRAKTQTKDSTPAAGAGSFVEYDEKDMEDVVEKVLQDRDDFVNGELGFTSEDQRKIEQVKMKFNKLYNETVPETHYGDLTIEQRRRLLEIDVARDDELARTIGKERWDKFKKFRNEYNNKMFKQQGSEKGIIFPLDI